MNSYSSIKTDIRKLAEETTSSKKTLEGGFGRASEEYWLGIMDIDKSGPNYLTKFMAALAILKLSNDANLRENYSLKETAFYLLGKLSESDIKELSSACIKSILSDAKDVYEFNWYVIHSNFHNET